MSCELCGLPEAMIDAEVAAVLINVRYTTLRSHLSLRKHEYPARYRLKGSWPRKRIRVLTAGEVKRLQSWFNWTPREREERVRASKRAGRAGHGA